MDDVQSLEIMSIEEKRKERRRKCNEVACFFGLAFVIIGICLRLAIAISFFPYLRLLRQSTFASVFVMAAIVSFLNILTVHKIFIVDTEEFFDQKVKEEQTPDDRPNYKGAIRLGAQLSLTEDIYSSLLVSCLDPLEVKGVLDDVNFKPVKVLTQDFKDLEKLW